MNCKNYTTKHFYPKYIFLLQIMLMSIYFSLYGWPWITNEWALLASFLSSCVIFIIGIIRLPNTFFTLVYNRSHSPGWLPNSNITNVAADRQANPLGSLECILVNCRAYKMSCGPIYPLGVP